MHPSANKWKDTENTVQLSVFWILLRLVYEPWAFLFLLKAICWWVTRWVMKNWLCRLMSWYQTLAMHLWNPPNENKYFTKWVWKRSNTMNLTITTIVHPETRKTMRKNSTILSNVLLVMTSEAPSVHCSSVHSISPEIERVPM